jgi:hypothetical protein
MILQRIKGCLGAFLDLKVILAVGALGIAGAGCVPVISRYTSVLGAKGSVVDAELRTPIRGALVRVSRPWEEDARTSTSRDGTFRVRSEHRCHIEDALHPTKWIAPLPEEVRLRVEQVGRGTARLPST